MRSLSSLITRKWITIVFILTLAFGIMAQTNITLQPYNGAGIDASVYKKDYSDTYGGANWGTANTIVDARTTTGGIPYTGRAFVKFDLSSVPRGADITSATLTLYGTGQHYNPVVSNASWFRRVTAAWDEAAITFNNQPGNNTLAQISMANSTSSGQNYSLDVTNNVQDMVNNPELNFGWVMLLQNESTTHSRLSFYSSDNATQSICPKLEITYEMRNSVYEETYDGNGNIIAGNKSYTDQLGRATQSLAKNITENLVIASETDYDVYGRPAITTLPAATDARMGYHSNLFTKSSSQYNYTNFETYGAVNKLDNPDAVDNSTAGTLGHYYSNNNTMESFVATTGYPYVRTEYTADPMSTPVRTVKAGDEFKMGSGHESRSYSMVSGDELRYIFNTNKSYKGTVSGADYLDCSSISVTGGVKAAKTVSIDADGKEIITYTVGNLTVATCQTGLSTACTMTTIVNTMWDAGTHSADIHLPASKKSSVKFPVTQYGVPMGGGSYNYVNTPNGDTYYTITDVKTNKLLVAGTDYSINLSTRAVSFLTSPYNSSTVSCILRMAYTYRQSFIDSVKANNWLIGNPTVQYDLDYAKWSVNYYDLAGRLRKAVPVKGINCSSPGTVTIATTYDYSSLGQLVATKSPDEGRADMNYDNEGKLRFSQNAEQQAANPKRFSYTAYDIRGRAVETGEYTVPASSGVFFQSYRNSYTGSPNVASTDPSIINTLNGLASGQCSDRSYIFYDKTPTAEAIPAGYSYVSQYAQAYTMGRVVKTKNSNMATWYSYDQMGRTTYKLQQFLDADYTTYQTTLDRQIKALDYTYNLNTGLLTSKTYEKNYTTEKLVHNYYYDADLRLSRVDVGIGAGGAATQVTYSYYKHGPLKRKAYRDNLQGMDYVYNVNGELKSINHPSLDENKDPGLDGKAGSPNSAFAKDMFGMTIDYHNTDYTRSSSNILSSSGTGGNDGFYNGRIHALRWKTRAVTNSINNGADYIDYGGANQAQLITGTTDEHMFRYSYDDQYRLNTANFGTFYNSTSTFTVSPNANYKEWGNSGASGINYDDNGNITNLKRNAYNGTLGLNMDDFSYTYTSNTNKLASIVDAIGANTYNDIEATTSKTFSYDNVGRLTASQAESVTGTTYTVRNKTNVVTFSNSNTSTYAYNDNNIKHKTKYFTNSNSKTKFNWFLTDEGGQIMAVYEYDQNAGTPTFGIIEEHLYAGGRLGVLNKTSGEIVYELTDHLGNVRASFKYIGSGNPQLVTRTDYYSFGGPMPGRSYNLGTYRFNFQGQESATAQNWNNFELRMYNPDLGRFCNPDPMGQFASAYVGMGNNPISGVDPTGGYVNGGTSDQWSAMQGRIRQQEIDDRFYRRGKYSEENRRKILNEYREKLNSLSMAYGLRGNDGLSYEGSQKYQELQKEYADLLSPWQMGDGGTDGTIMTGIGAQAGENNDVGVMDEGWWASLSIVMGSRDRAEQQSAKERVQQQNLKNGKDVINTPSGSYAGKVFTAAYLLGSNDAVLDIHLLQNPDQVSISYGDANNSHHLITTDFVKGAHKFNLQDYSSEDLTGKIVYVTVIGNPDQTRTTDWNYTFTNPGGSSIGYSSGFSWFKADNGGWIINWDKSRDIWR